MTPKFKVGDVVIRKFGTFAGMKPGYQDEVIKVTPTNYGGKYELKIYGPGGHAEYNLTSQSELNEQEMKKLLGVSDEEKT